MSTKAAFIAALGGATQVIGAGKVFTTTHAADTLTITAHGKYTGEGPMRLSSTGQLPTELAPQKATNGLTFTAGSIVNDEIQVGEVYYQFASNPTSGTPTGESGSPFLVDVGADDAESLANLRAAINATGTPGVTYAEEIVEPNPLVEATASNGTTVTLRARTAGTAGNSIALVVTGDDGLAADAATFSGGTNAVDYYILVINEDTIKLSLTPNGNPVAFGDDGSGTHRIYGTAAGLGNAIEDVLNNCLTAPGSRVCIPEFNRTRLWQEAVSALI